MSSWFNGFASALSAVSSCRVRRSRPRSVGIIGEPGSDAAPFPRTVILPLAEGIESRVLLSVSVTTWHNDPMRVGVNTQETVLTPSSVSSGKFGLRHTVQLDGAVYAQPLYLPAVQVPGQGTHNVVYVATEHDSVYALDARTGGVLWKRSYLGKGIFPVSSEDVDSEDIYPEIGITGTPIIDPASHTIYFVTKVKKVGTNGQTSFEQRLHAVDTRSGAEKKSVVIRASVPGAGAGRVINGDDVAHPMVPFDPLRQSNRPGLLLLNGTVYVGFGSHGDNDPYHGWLMGYNATSLKQTAVLNLSPDGLRSPIWMAGAAPATDGKFIYAGTGNGTFDAPLGGQDYGDSFLKISTAGGKLKVVDSFTPFDQTTQGLRADADFGSGGVMLVPGTNLAVEGDKQGKLYVVDRNHPGGFHLDGNHIVQTLQVTPDLVYFTPAFFNGSIYFAGVDDHLKQYKLVNGKFVGATSQSAETFGYPGATPSVSSNGSKNAIVWAIERGTPPSGGGSTAEEQALAGPVILHAYDPNNLSHELFRSDKGGKIPGGIVNGAVKFSVPTIADGRVYVGTNGGLQIYGLA